MAEGASEICRIAIETAAIAPRVYHFLIQDSKFKIAIKRGNFFLFQLSSLISPLSSLLFPLSSLIFHLS
jgi:hypothetical protein